MRTPLKWSVVLVVALAAGCGNDRELPNACHSGQGALASALRSAPRPVRINGVPISACMTDNADAADVQELGLAVNGTAARLADVVADRPRSPEAVELGYLSGAVRRGSHRSQGLHSELVHRLETELGRVDRTSPAFRRGERAGLRLG